MQQLTEGAGIEKEVNGAPMSSGSSPTKAPSCA